ncbi:MAG: hypothetical protein Ct9H300mP19_13220 [Dehalococcoidia bacterium]|nr:MAG: hypothetical protein Ct9H300mP19_13220 [Dehalococcoidia bacterium]
MTVSRKQALKHGYKLLEHPRSHIRVELNQDKSGVSVTHKGRVITRVFLNRSGMNAAVAISEAMGVNSLRLVVVTVAWCRQVYFTESWLCPNSTSEILPLTN